MYAEQDPDQRHETEVVARVTERGTKRKAGIFHMKIVVIGTDQGLGKLLAKALRERGHEVAAGLLSMKNCPEETDGILFLPMDVTKEDQLKQAADTIRSSMGKLDCVVCVAGVLLPSDRTCTLLDEPLEDLRRHMDVNAIGLLSAFRTFYKDMEKGSRFFAVTSEGGSFTLKGKLFPGYSVSKTAANKFVQVLRETVSSEDVDLIAVHPGRMNTEMGRTTAQIEPEVAVEGFIRLIEGDTPIDSSRQWFINYLGEPMPV